MYRQSREYIYGMLPQVTHDLIETVIPMVREHEVVFKYILLVDRETWTRRFLHRAQSRQRGQITETRIVVHKPACIRQDSTREPGVKAFSRS